MPGQSEIARAQTIKVANQQISDEIACAVIGLVTLWLFLSFAGCRLVRGLMRSEGEHPLTTAPSRPVQQTHLILFAMDGIGYNQFMQALRSGNAIHLDALLGKPTGANLYEHAYSVPDVTTVMPSSSIPGWASIITGFAPAQTGLVGDEFFVRNENRFYAPIALSSRDPKDFISSIDKDLLGKLLHVPTVYQRINGSSYVSLLYVYHGAAVYSTLGGREMVDLFGHIITGAIEGETVRQSIAAPLDKGSVSETVEVLRSNGIPSLMVVYFPGPDIYAHGSPDPLPSQVEYVETNIDRDVATVLEEYARNGVLDHTYVMFVSDHGHTPVLKDENHDLDADDHSRLAGLLRKQGFRVRERGVELPEDKQDYQAVIADQGFSAFVYLADRSTCRRPGQRCRWKKPPRFEEDVVPVLEALRGSDRRGTQVQGIDRKIDLVFARDSSMQSSEREAPPFEVFDGDRLVPMRTYFSDHQRPDLMDVERRVTWLSEGPYGDRAGDIMIVGESGMSLPIDERYYFSNVTYYAWHGSLSTQDSHIPLLIARKESSGEDIERIVEKVVSMPPSALDVAPLIESLLSH